MRHVLVEAARRQWNIRIAERYPHGRGVTKYLARYVRGGPIKEHRLVALAGGQVTFRYGNHREVDERGKPCPQELRLRVEEFLRRWSEHVPLPGVHTVRAWGLYASTQRAKLERCRAQLPHPEASRVPPSEEEGTSSRNHAYLWEQCPVCQQSLVPVQVLPRAGAPPARHSWLEAA